MVILAPIYAAREKSDKKISSKILAQKLALNGVRANYIADFDEIKNYLNNAAVQNSKTVIITMGAGDIYKISDKLTESAYHESKS